MTDTTEESVEESLEKFYRFLNYTKSDEKLRENRVKRYVDEFLPGFFCQKPFGWDLLREEHLSCNIGVGRQLTSVPDYILCIKKSEIYSIVIEVKPNSKKSKVFIYYKLFKSYNNFLILLYFD